MAPPLLLLLALSWWTKRGRREGGVPELLEPAARPELTLLAVALCWLLPTLLRWRVLRAERDAGARTLRAECELGEAGKPCGGRAGATGVRGHVLLTQRPDTTLIQYEISGLSPGSHGFHIHEKADFSNGCASAGPHYNPHGRNHGGPDDEERHMGDLGNVKAGADGCAKGELFSSLVRLEGEYSVLGRSIMVHADPDDLGRGDNSQPGPPPVNGKCSLVTGNAGARVACGVIRLLPPGDAPSRTRRPTHPGVLLGSLMAFLSVSAAAVTFPFMQV